MSHLSMLRGTRKGGWGSPSMLRGREGGGGCWVPSGSTARPPPSLTSGSCRAGGDRETPSAPPNMGGGHTQQRHPISFPPPPQTPTSPPQLAPGEGKHPGGVCVPPPTHSQHPRVTQVGGGGKPTHPQSAGRCPALGGLSPSLELSGPVSVQSPLCPFLPHFSHSCPILVQPHFACFCPISAQPHFARSCPVWAQPNFARSCLFCPFLPLPPILVQPRFARSCPVWAQPNFACSCLFCPFLPQFVRSCPVWAQSNFACSCPNSAAPAPIRFRFARSCPVSAQPHFAHFPVTAPFWLSPVLPIPALFHPPPTSALPIPFWPQFNPFCVRSPTPPPSHTTAPPTPPPNFRRGPISCRAAAACATGPGHAPRGGRAGGHTPCDRQDSHAARGGHTGTFEGGDRDIQG